MSTNEIVVSNETAVSTAASTAVTTDVTPSTSHSGSAQARLQELRQMRELIPYFVIPASARERARLNSAASVPPEFVELTAVAVVNEKSLVRGDATPPAEVRDRMGYAEAYGPLADELEALAQFIRHSITAARHQAGVEALTTYALAQRLVKQPGNAHLAPYVTDMRRALGRVRKLTAEERKQRRATRAARKTAKVTAEAPAKATAEPSQPS